MQSLNLFHEAEGSLIADYASRMGEALVRRNAELEIRAARIEAELSIKARSEFLANMNHELRTPLNAIIGFATMMHQDDDYDLDSEKRRTYSEYILQSADLLLGHINTLLEVAALESGGVAMANDGVELGNVLQASLDRVNVRAAAANVTVTRRDEGVDVAGWGDEERLGQAVDHLLQAAIKSCGESGRILVRATLDERGWPEIAIRDDGAGFTDEEIREALTAFSEVHRGLDKTFAGPGVGYAIAKTFVEMQGGRFSIKSRKNKGTLVRIALPKTQIKPQTLETEEPAQQASQKPPTEIELERSHDAA